MIDRSRALSGLFGGACALALAAAPHHASAGGFDLTGQPIDILFEEGTYAEGRVGLVKTDVEGEVTTFGQPTGQIANNLTFITGGVKADLTDRISAAVIVDRPFNRSTTYSDSIYKGTEADVLSNSVALVGRFKIGPYFSVYAGPKVQSSSIDLTGQVVVPGATPFRYDIDVNDYDFGYIAGAAVEWPKYKARAAVTYNSEVTHDFDAQEIFGGGALVGNSSFETTTPQSINLDLQGPISPKTLVKANIRWVNWDGVNFSPTIFVNNFGRPVVEYDHDTIRYRLTVAHRFTDALAGFVTGSFEEAQGESISLFKTTDGITSAGGGVVVSFSENVDVTLGGEYFWVDGLAGRQVPTNPIDTQFGDGDGFALGMKVGITF